jgi:hypothetical protein
MKMVCVKKVEINTLAKSISDCVIAKGLFGNLEIPGFLGNFLRMWYHGHLENEILKMSVQQCCFWASFSRFYGFISLISEISFSSC